MGEEHRIDGELLRDACRRAERYLEGLDARAAGVTAADAARLAELGGPLPDAGEEPARVLALLDEIGSPATMATAGRRYFGFVVGGTQPAPLAATMLAAAWDQVAGMVLASPVACALEEISLGWILDVLDLPRGCAGGLTTGATMANLSCLAAARHTLCARRGWDVEEKGLTGAPEFPVVVGDEVHASLLKALGLLGLGRARVHRVPTDDQGRLRPERLPDLDEPGLVCLQAGNVNTGSFDDAAAICAHAARSESWVHVDGAFGLWARASRTLAPLGAGLEGADSWAVDAHKWLNVPYDSGIALCRDPGALRGAMAITAPYLMMGDPVRQPTDFTPEMSRRARGIEVWAALRSLGRRGLEELLDRCCAHARRFAAELAGDGFEIRNDVVLNQVLVSFGDDAATDHVIARLQEDGTCWCGGTTWHGRRAMRIAVSSWATTDEDVTQSLAAMRRAAAP